MDHEPQELVRRARDFAVSAHRAIDQRRKYTDEPYETHLEEVAELVERFGGDAAMVAAAWLHDTVEDTETTLNDIEREFGPDVAALVDDLTDVSRPQDGNRATRMAIDREHAAGASPRAKTIKLADICSNITTIVELNPGFARVYVPEKEAVLEVLEEGDQALKEHARAVVAQARRELCAQR